LACCVAVMANKRYTDANLSLAQLHQVLGKLEYHSATTLLIGFSDLPHKHFDERIDLGQIVGE
jgi:hypothetical protein